MGFLNKILEKLGIGRAPASVKPGTGPTAPPPPRPVASVDVVAQMEQRAAANPQKLNWRTSIVDLLKLLEIDSSFQRARSWPRSWVARRSSWGIRRR